MQAIQRIITDRYAGQNLPITLVLPGGSRVPLSREPLLDVIAANLKGLRALSRPELGALARAYVHGDVDFTGSARSVLGIAEAMVGAVEHGRESLGARWRHFMHQRRANRSNIAYHYDVSNAFYRMWLDERMVYSCAYYRTAQDTLEQAQVNKIDHICRKLRLAPGETLLDIGCGWGALVMHAAQHYGVKAHGITLSKNQFDHVTAEVARRGLQDQVKVELRDYLDLPGDVLYDKVSSVGMFEHVGVARFPRYFGKIFEVLKPGGLVLNHGITHNALGATGLGSGIGEFVEDYVFPGGELTHVSKVIEGMAREGLEAIDAEALREHYAKTLWEWVTRLEANADAARREVGEERFRVWRIYMAGSAHAFDRGWLSLWQILAGKPLPDGSLPHPLTREYMYAR